MAATTADAIVVVELTPAEARALTDHIKLTADHLWRLLLKAYEGKAWQVLGYPSWREYAQTEFEMSQSQVYRLLDQGRVLRALEWAVGSPMGEIVSERVARDLKPQLETVTSDIRNRIESGEDPAAAVTDVISKARATSYLDSRKRANRGSRFLESLVLDLTSDLDWVEEHPVERVDPDRLPEWIAGLRESARRLNRLAARLEGGRP